jgi:MOSC domain-containing protein YiiM
VARIDSVNVGSPRGMPNYEGPTGIFKAPAVGPVTLGLEGLAGDYIADTKHHGGPDQAVYLYFADDYAWWETKLGRKLAPGTFGDNLTLSEIASADLAVGDRLVAGDVVLEVTAPRIPCNTLARRMQDSGFVRAFRDAERPGAYCRVVKTGAIAAGAPLTHHPYAGPRVGVVDMFHDNFIVKTLDPSRIRAVLAAPIAIRERRNWEAFLAAAEAKA